MRKIKTNGLTLFLLMVLGFCFLTLFTPGLSVESAKPTPAKEIKTPAPSPNQDELSPTFYEPYVKGEKQLGFTPDPALVEQTISMVKSRFVEPVNDEKLYGQMKEEIKKVLKIAKVDGKAIETLAPDASLPKKAAELLSGKIKPELVYFACLMAIPKGVGDPFTGFMLPGQYQKMMELMQEKGFGGVGMSIDLDRQNNNQLFIVEVFEGTPAAKAGLQSEDRIMAIDGFATKGITLEEAQARIRGNVDTKVILSICHKGQKNMIEVPVTRGMIVVHSIKQPPLILEDNIGYIKMRFFSQSTGPELTKALDYIKEKGAKALILDIRNNGGGYLNTAVDIAGKFLPTGTIVVKVGERNGRTVNYASSNTTPFELPMVLLVNKYSASASEILCGCLQDYKKAMLIGTKTFGKGSVQQILPLKENTAVKITMAYFYTPNGKKINQEGVSPDVTLDMELSKIGKTDDLQLQKAVELLKTKLPKEAKNSGSN